MKKVFAFLLCVLLSAQLPFSAEAQEQQAEKISDISIVKEAEGFRSIQSLFDGNVRKGYKIDGACKLTIAHESGFGSLYLIFGKSYGTYTVTDNASGKTVVAGEKGYVHEYLDMVALFGSAPTSVTLSFDNGVLSLVELEAYTVGKIPDSVQVWEDAPEGKTDMILFATHSDDDQLFFAGLLPYYAVERECEVLVVYLTNHWNTADFRIHEVLNGLWSVGIRNYPVFGPYADFADAHSIDEAFEKFAVFHHTRESMTGFLVEQMRRYKPLVVVGHDVNGEYGHIQHRVYSLLTREAVAVSGDPSFAPDTAEKYGAWEVPKTYIHLYDENKIVMNWDQPMESFGGMTPYQVSRDLGFACHSSQFKNWKKFFTGHDTAASFKYYSPCEYGLFRTNVGVDVSKNDMFENLTTYAEQQRLAEEEAKRQEQARIEAEEAAKREEAARKEEETIMQEAEAQKNVLREQESNPVGQTVRGDDTQVWVLIASGAVAVACAVFAIVLLNKRKK